MITNNTVYFDDLTHSYLTDEGVFLMGVTSLMRKHGLSPDYTDIPAAVLNKAAERGSKVHKDIELYCKGNLGVVMTPELRAFIKCGIKWVANEYLVSDNEIVASSIDIVADSGDGKYDLIDVKTTSTLHIEPLSWQLSIYAYLFELQNPDLKVGKLYGLHIRGSKAKMVEVERKPAEEIERLFQAERDGRFFTPAKIELAQTTDTMLLKLKDATAFVTELKTQLKMAEEAEKQLKQYLISEMEKGALKSLENEQVKVVYVAPSERESIDKDRLRDNHPDIYEEYLKKSPVAASIRIKIK